MAGRTSYIQCPETGKMIEKSEYYSENRQRQKVTNEFHDFISPIDGSRIGDRRQLANHNKKHGVTHCSDYSQEHFTKAAAKREEILSGKGAAQKASRIDDIKRTLHHFEHRR